MQIREEYLSGDHTSLECPEDSVFFPPRIISGSIIVPILQGDSQEMKHYVIRSVTQYMTFMESSIGIQALGVIDHYGEFRYIYVLEKENG